MNAREPDKMCLNVAFQERVLEEHSSLFGGTDKQWHTEFGWLSYCYFLFLLKNQGAQIFGSAPYEHSRVNTVFAKSTTIIGFSKWRMIHPNGLVNPNTQYQQINVRQIFYVRCSTGCHCCGVGTRSNMRTAYALNGDDRILHDSWVVTACAAAFEVATSLRSTIVLVKRSLDG
ncbi:hypothetical protein CC78DRAFT_539735 [Lojkania enalia]|uniref:Uncharacterized protein n=1 Tax=Lojkania enalia TaxID=147567 RepID=A0A9P4TPW8_9PLEO|nr:hypothetical protein CC78DRAFT_539735 [Didymosphaeria enalia]